MYVCVCVRVERCARLNGNYRQPPPMGTNSRAPILGFVHNKNETWSHTHARPPAGTHRGIHNLRHPAPSSAQPHAIGEATLTEPPQHTSKSQSGPKVPPTSPPQKKRNSERQGGGRTATEPGLRAAPRGGKVACGPAAVSPHTPAHTRAPRRTHHRSGRRGCSPRPRTVPAAPGGGGG